MADLDIGHTNLAHDNNSKSSFEENEEKIGCLKITIQSRNEI